MQIDSSNHLAPTQLFLPVPRSDQGERAHAVEDTARQAPPPVLGSVDDAEQHPQGEATFLTIPTTPASAAASALALSPEIFKAAGVDLHSLAAISIPASTPSSEVGPGRSAPARTDSGAAATSTAAGEGAAAEPEADEDTSKTANSALAGEQELSEEEQQEVEELKARDREVRQHEQAHSAAGGQYTRGGPQYEYTSGPDGKRYATGGEVSIDVSKVADNPLATIGKMQVVYRAAMAPAEPSSADRAIAGEAKQKEAEARRELAEMQRQESTGEAAGGEEAAAPEGSGRDGSGETGSAEGNGRQVTLPRSGAEQGAVPLLDQIV